MKTVVNISDIRIRMDGPHEIATHPYYVALERSDRTIYDDYVKSKVSQRYKKSSSWDSYIDLVNSIMFDGFRYNPRDPLILKKKKNGLYLGCHGRHRLCILYYVYKGNCQLVIRNIAHKKYELVEILDN
jgi:hypothetical protein